MVQACTVTQYVQWPPPGQFPIVVPAPIGAAPAPTEPTRRGPHPVVWIVVAVVVLGMASVVGDWAARTIEMSRLLETVAASESGMTIAQDRMSDVAVPEKGEGRPTDEDAAKASDEIAAIAGEGKAAVEAAGRSVADLSFLPWHTDLLAAQQAYLGHNAAWVAYLGAGSSDPASLAKDDGRIESTWLIAQQAMRAAEPPLALPFITDEVQSLFFDEDENQGPSGTDGPGLSAEGP